MTTNTTPAPAETATPAAPADRLVWRAELCEKMNVGSEAVRRWIKDGKLPKPDVAITRRTKCWKLSTLRAHGVGLI